MAEERWALGTREMGVSFKHGQPPPTVAKLRIRREKTEGTVGGEDVEGKYEDQEMSVVSNERKAGRKMLKSRTRSARHHAPASFSFLFKIRAESVKEKQIV